MRCSRHPPDLAASGRVVGVLPSSAADGLSGRGGPGEVAEPLIDVLRSAPAALDSVPRRALP